MDDWRDSASCRGTDVNEYYATETMRTEVRERLEMRCGGCPVYESCLDWAVRYEEYGYWAGTLPKDRVRIRKEVGITLSRVELRPRHRMERSEHRSSESGMET